MVKRACGRHIDLSATSSRRELEPTLVLGRDLDLVLDLELSS